MRNAALHAEDGDPLPVLGALHRRLLALGPMDLLAGDTVGHQRGSVIYLPLALFDILALSVLFPLLLAILDAILVGIRREKGETFAWARAMLDWTWLRAGAWSKA